MLINNKKDKGRKSHDTVPLSLSYCSYLQYILFTLFVLFVSFSYYLFIAFRHITADNTRNNYFIFFGGGAVIPWIPVYNVFNGYIFHDFYSISAKLIILNLHVKTWILKLFFIPTYVVLLLYGHVFRFMGISL
jgi:hypothetical protein